MARKLALPLALAASLATAGAAGALVHHGWSEYNANRPVTLTGRVENIRFSNPHVMVDLRVAGRPAKKWDAVLAPPSRMQARGLPVDSMRAGMTATVYGYPHKTKSSEMRAERIIVGRDTTELR